jgi:DNA-binding NarL/FixJ family response regulator
VYPFSERVIDACARRAPAAAPPLDHDELLTARERDVLQRAAQGFAHAAIGSRVLISSRTEETPHAKLLHTLSLQTQTDLVRFAVARGLIPGTR